MNAQKAQELTKKATAKISKKHLKKHTKEIPKNHKFIMRVIKNAVKDGCTSTEIHDYFSPENITALKNLGFFVQQKEDTIYTDRFRSKYIIVSWFMKEIQ